MAVAFDAVGPSSLGSTSASPNTWTHVVGSSATHLLVGATWDKASDAGATMSATYNGVSMTSLGVWHTGGGTAGFLQVWSLDIPGGLTTGSHSVVVTGTNTPSGINGGSISFTGGATLSAVQSNVSSGTATNPTITFTGSSSGNMVVAFEGSGTLPTAAGSATSRFICSGDGVAGAGFSAGSTIAGGGSVTLNWTMTADFYAVAAIEVRAPSTAPPIMPAQPGLTWLRRFRGAPMPWPMTPNPPTFAAATEASGSGTAYDASGSRYITGLAGSGATSYFVDNSGAPRLVIGDEPWGLVANSGRWNAGDWQTTITNYITSRNSQGFTALYLKPMGSTITGALNDDGSHWDGVMPFQSGTHPTSGRSGNDPSSGLNETFWTRVDYLLTQAQAQNITIFLNIGQTYDLQGAVAGDMAQGWSSTQFTAYGSHLGARYAHGFPNLIWMIGDDADADSNFDLIVTALRAAGANQPISFEGVGSGPGNGTTGRTMLTDGSSTHWGTGNSTVQFDFVYYYGKYYYGVEQAYLEANPVGVIGGDGYFYQASGDERAMRQECWWTLSSGGRGRIFGSEAIWTWDTNAAANTTNAATQLFFTSHIKTIRTAFEGLTNWHLLIPDTSNQLITAGRGTRATYSNTQYEPAFTDSYVTGSRVADGSLAVIYMSHGSTITIDQTKMVSGYVASRMDPVTGAATVVPSGSTYNSTAWGNNSVGDPDWVLVLQAPVPTAPQPPLTSNPGTTWWRRFKHITLPYPGAISATNASAIDADATGVANDASVNIGATDQTGTSATGVANDAAPSVAAADQTGTAATGVANDAAPSIFVNDSTGALGNGDAQDATVNITIGFQQFGTPGPTWRKHFWHITQAFPAGIPLGATNAQAIDADATGDAQDASVAIQVTDTGTTATGAANDATTTVGATDQTGATGFGVANDAAASISVPAGGTTGTGAAFDATVTAVSGGGLPGFGTVSTSSGGSSNTDARAGSGTVTDQRTGNGATS